MKKSHFWPPQPVKKVNKEWFKPKGHKRTFDFLVKSWPHAKIQHFLTCQFRDLESRCTLSTCYFFERLRPLPQPKGFYCDSLHGHLGGRRAPISGVSSLVKRRFFIIQSLFVNFVMPGFIDFILQALSENAVYSP